VVSLVAHQTGITVLHSITSGLVIGSTLKFVRGIVATGLEEEPQTEAILDRAADLIGRATNRFDADLGVHLNSGALRAGVTLRNASEPAFKAADGEEFVLERQARAGVAVVLVATTVAADLDLTSEREDPAGRRVAIGVEQRLMSRMALRAGLRVATGDQKDRVGSIGGSVAVRTGIWVDAFWSRGDHEDTRWGVAARMAY
jgi:hypothetical protein